MQSRPFSHVRTVDAWRRAHHAGTTVDLPGGGAMLAWEDPPAPDVAGGSAPAFGAGMGFDSLCRLYRTLPDAGRVERYPWEDGPRRGPAEDLVAAAPPAPAGEFDARPVAAGPLAEPRALALDEDDRLWIAEAGAGRVVLWDLWSRRLLRRIALPGRPLDLARRGRQVLALLDDGAGVAEIEDRAVRRVLALPDLTGLVPASARARRLAVAPDRSLTLMLRGGGGWAWVVGLAVDRTGRLVTTSAAAGVRGATDLEWLDEQTLVVARAPGQSFLRWVRGAGPGGFDVMPGLLARGYDGLGIALAPQGRGIAFWSSDGPRLAVRARVEYLRSGAVTSYRLDADAPATRWGRLFVDACLPPETHVFARVYSSEAPDDPGDVVLDPLARPLHRRESGRELPWIRPGADDAFETYEAPVAAAPGRFLWVTLELRGNGRATPRVRSLRVERPAHEHLGRLPRSFSRDPAAGEFLQRYLALADGLLSDLGGRADERATLLSTSGAPGEALGWLAGFLGLVLDDRWPEAVRRRVLDEAPWLLRFRGTKQGLERMLELIVGLQVTILERWRLRGLGGALLRASDAETGGAVVGGGLRLGGAVGSAGDEPIDDDVFASHAHRFAVLVPAVLSEEQTGMVTHALDVHRPAHTIFELCTLGSGMSVGRGLHLGLLSTIGATGGFEPLTAGHGVVGGGIVGRTPSGTRVGASAAGRDSRVG